MEFILADENQSVTGFVVTNKDGAVTIINQNAVRRFQSHNPTSLASSKNAIAAPTMSAAIAVTS